MVRLWEDPDQGLAPEPVTVKEFRKLQYECSAWTVADAWLTGRLVYIDISLPELDDERIPLRGLTLRKSAQDLSDAGEIMCSGRLEQTSDHGRSVAWGYDVAPTGVCETFGAYDCRTRAWLNIHRDGPALLFRRDDAEVEPLIDRWLEFWAHSLDLRRPWPKAEEHNLLITPASMLLIHSLRMNRKRRYKGRNVRRFLGLSG
jgi:hypothetical protein